MVKTCVIKWCNSRWGDIDVLRAKKLGFYKIPGTSKLLKRAAWLKVLAINRPGYETHPQDCICGLHFHTGKPNGNPNHPDFQPQLFVNPSQQTRKQFKLKLEQYQKTGKLNDDQYRPDFRPQKKMLQVCLEKAGKLNDDQYRPDFRPQKKMLQVCLEKAGCEQPQPPKQEKVSSCPPQQGRFNFCEDCSSKRVREVKAQLEKLFTEKSWRPNHCGICNRRFLNPSVAALLHKKVPVTETTECLESESDNIANNHDYVHSSKRALEDHDFKDHPKAPKTSEALQSGEASCETSKKVKTAWQKSGVTPIRASNYQSVLWVKPGVIQLCASRCQSMSKSNTMDSSGSNVDNAKETDLADEGDNDSDEINEGLIKVDTDKTLSLAKDRLNNRDSLCESNQSETLPADKDDMPYKNKATPIIHLDLSDATQGLDSRVIAMLDRSARNPFQPFKCKHCTSREYASASSFVKHMQETHQEGLAITKPYVCNKCSKQFWLIEQLQAHLVNHETFHCPYPPCLRTFQTKGALISHERVHKPEGQKNHIRTKNHKKIPRKKQPIICSICGKHFMCKSYLNVHKSVHSDDRPFECLQCGKAFKLQRILNLHKRGVHDNDKPFMCEVCGKAWISRNYLSIHMRTHSGEKPFLCDKCDYRCARKDYLDKHLRIHSGEKPYKCNQCSKAFTQCTSLTLHRKKYHAEPVTKTEQVDDFVTIDFPIKNEEDQHPKN